MKVAAVHCFSKKNILDNITEVKRVINILENEKVDFALFPELGLSGYSNNSADLKIICKQLDKTILELLKISETVKIAFAVGFPEEIDNKFYISQFIIEKGTITGKHQKTHLGPSEQNVFSPSDSLNIFNVKNSKLGIQLCYESHFPELSYLQATEGADFLCFAFASPRETTSEKSERFKSYLRARAYDNSCFVIACNITGNYGNNKKYAGVSLIISPKGKILAESTGYNTGYCIYDCDISEIEKIKKSSMGFFNKYRRTLKN